jgi:hypothetical protein
VRCYVSEVSVEECKSELAKLKSLSSKIYKEELIIAAKRTYCYRQAVVNVKKPSFAACVNEISCYATLPQIIS